MYDTKLVTNNAAELAAAELAVRMIVSTNFNCEYNFAKVIGDSKLVINFLNRVFEPRVSEFYEICDSIRNFIKANRLHVQFLHVKREYNLLADHIGRLAETK